MPRKTLNRGDAVASFITDNTPEPTGSEVAPVEVDAEITPVVAPKNIRQGKGRVRTVINITPALRDDIKFIAWQRRISMSDVIDEVMSEYCKRYHETHEK